MSNNMIMVESASDWTVVVNLPEFNLRRTWTKRGAKYPIDREILIQAYYNPAVETLFKEGSLITDDIEFLKEVGLMTEEDKPVVAKVDEKLMNRMIKLMPLADFKVELAKFTHTQIDQLAEYAIANYLELKMDRIDILSKVSGRDMMRAIANQKASQED